MLVVPKSSGKSCLKCLRVAGLLRKQDFFSSFLLLGNSELLNALPRSFCANRVALSYLLYLRPCCVPRLP